jgi:hypothetical protein
VLSVLSFDIVHPGFTSGRAAALLWYAGPSADIEREVI